MFSPFARRAAVASISDIFESFATRSDLALAYRRALRLKIGLVRHETATGALPKTLAELVPTYLTTLPTDPFSGNDFLYDPGRGAVWSVGKDRTDGGGTQKPVRGFARSTDADPTLWVAPLPVGSEPEARPDRRSRRARSRRSRESATP